MTTARTLTLADAALPRASALRDVVLMLGASLLTAAAARVAIPVPWSPVPLTGQTFAVLLTGAALGARRGLLAQVLYLLEGAAGLPVFAGGLGGAMVLGGPTGGFLVAFPLAAAVTGLLAERGWDRHFGTMLAAMLLGNGVILVSGLAVLTHFVPASGLMSAGFLTFLPGDLLKAVAAAIVLPAAWRAVRGHVPRQERSGLDG